MEVETGPGGTVGGHRRASGEADLNSRDFAERDAQIERIYAEFLERSHEGIVLDISALCGAYPQFAWELRERHGRLETQHPAVESVPQPAAPAAAAPQPPGPPAVPADLQRYSLLRRLARGGMGVIYKAWDDRLRRELAMKLIRNQEQDASAPTRDELLGRFVREAEIMARLDHPGVVPIHDIGVDELGRKFFTMRLIHGKRLDQVYAMAREGRDGWNQTRVLDVIVKACQTLAFAHSRGIIHRDLKPENIMVGRFGETYVMDWGLAKNIRDADPDSPQLSDPLSGDSEQDLARESRSTERPGSGSSVLPGSFTETTAGSILGTAPYMPPEQAAGRLAELDERSDVYSLGAILYELLTGRRPYSVPGQATGAKEILLAVVGGPPRPIATIAPRVPGELTAICEKAMARRKEDRYQSMQAMSDDLRAYLENRVVQAHRTGAVAELRKWVLRNRRTAVTAFVGTLACLGGLLCALEVQRRSNAAIRIERDEKQAALDAQIEARNAADAQQRRAEGLLLARESLDARPNSPGLALLLGIASDERTPSFEANSALLSALAVHHEFRTLSGHQDGLRWVAASPDGKRIVTASKDHTANVWDASTGERGAWLVGHTDWVTQAEFSPDGTRVVTTSMDGTAALWDPATGKRLREFRGHDGWVLSVAFDPAGTLIVTGSEDSTARVWNVESGLLEQILAGHGARVSQVEFSPDGKSIVTGSSDQSARLWDAVTGEERCRMSGHSGGLGVTRFGKDGNAVMTAASRPRFERSPEGRARDVPADDHVLRLWDARSGDLWAQVEFPAPVVAAAFNPDRTQFVAGAADGSVRIGDAATGRIVATFETNDGAVEAVAFSRDGLQCGAAMRSGRAYLWNLSTARQTARLAGHLDAAIGIAFSAGDKVATASRDGTARLWHARRPHSLPGEARDSAYSRSIVSRAGDLVAVSTSDSATVRLATFPGCEPVATLPLDGPVLQTLFSPDGSQLGMVSNLGTVQLWSAESGLSRTMAEQAGPASQIQFDDKGRLIVASRTERKFTIWNAAGIELLATCSLPECDHLFASPDGRWLVGWPSDGARAELWSCRQTRRIADLPWITQSGNSPGVIWSPGGERMIAYFFGQPGVQVWEPASGRLLHTLNQAGAPIRWATISPEGDWLAVSSDDLACRLWNLNTGEPATQIGGSVPAEWIVVGPGCEQVFVRWSDKSSGLWNGQTGEQICLIGDVDNYIHSAQFSADGRFLVTANRDRGQAVLWNPRTGRKVALLESPATLIGDAAITPDGEWFVTTLRDGSFHAWATAPEIVARQLKPRDLTPLELDRFQAGSDAGRTNLWQEQRQRDLVELLKAASRITRPAADQTALLDTRIERGLRSVIESLGRDRTQLQKAGALEPFAREVEDLAETSAVAAAALARICRETGDTARADQAWRRAIRLGQGEHLSSWIAWAVLCLGERGFSARQLLDEWPAPETGRCADLKWAIAQQARHEPLRINCGGDDYESADGRMWHHDCFFGGGHLFGESTGNPQPSQAEIQGTDDDLLYQTERWFNAERPEGEREYRIPLARGRYRVVLHFAEIYYTQRLSRLLDVLAEGEVALVQCEPGELGFVTARSSEFEVAVDDGLLNLVFRAVKENPKVSALEICRLDE